MRWTEAGSTGKRGAFGLLGRRGVCLTAVTALLALLIFKPMRISRTVAGCMLILFFAYVAASTKAHGF